MCKYCDGNEEAPYMSTRYIDLFMGNSLGDRRALIVRHVGCPKYVNCTQKEMNISSVFEINYCPNCGADLRTKRMEKK